MFIFFTSLWSLATILDSSKEIKCKTPEKIKKINFKIDNDLDNNYFSYNYRCYSPLIKQNQNKCILHNNKIIFIQNKHDLLKPEDNLFLVRINRKSKYQIYKYTDNKGQIWRFYTDYFQKEKKIKKKCADSNCSCRIEIINKKTLKFRYLLPHTKKYSEHYYVQKQLHKHRKI